MRRFQLQLFVLLAGCLVLLLITTTTAFSAEPLVSQQASSPETTPLHADELEQFWQELYPSADPFAAANENNVYLSKLLAKAAPDECFNGIGADESADSVPDCINGQPKVNEAYVWGMTDYSDTIWFGTAPNVHCLVMGGFLGSSTPIETGSYTCEFGEGPYSPPLPDVIGDWRPPSLYTYDNEAEALTEISPNGLTGYPFDPRFISNTLGIRSAATFGDYIFFAGPAFTPTASINMFMFNAATQQYLGSRNLPAYNNIRKWLEVDGELYTAVGTSGGGAVLRYTGDPTNPATRFNFVVVGTFDADGAELALHEGRIFVNTWPNGFSNGVVAGLWMSPVVPPGGLPEDTSEWELIFKYDEYEPDPVIARTYGSGALFSYQGDLFWGTMHVPFLATLAHLTYYEEYYEGEPDPEEIAAAMLGSQRSISIFQGRNFGTAEEEIELAYGLSELPAFNTEGDFSWNLKPNPLGEPKYGTSGFGNMFNNYTWSMAEYDGQLFVGTMDWSYLLDDIIQTFLGSTFTGWSGGCYGPTCSLSLLDSTAVTATFTLDKHPLIVTLAGDGSGSVLSSPAGINCGTACDELYDYGTLVTLTQTVSAGSVFAGWEGACSGTGTTCTVTITDTNRVTATFTNNRFPLTINLVGNGSGNVVSVPPGIGCSQPSCTADFDLGVEVALSAVAFNGSSFEGWSGACSGLAPCLVTISATNIVTASFIQNSQQATIQADGELEVGTPVSLTATLSMNPINECTWDFGDGNTQACEPSVGATGVNAIQDVPIQTTHAYTQAGVYVVNIAATNDAGTIFAVQEVTIQTPTAEEPVAPPLQPGELYLPYMNR